MKYKRSRNHAQTIRGGGANVNAVTIQRLCLCTWEATLVRNIAARRFPLVADYAPSESELEVTDLEGGAGGNEELDASSPTEALILTPDGKLPSLK